MVTNKGKARAKLENVPQDKGFYCHDGRVAKNLEELAAALRQMGEETFRYHANESKNDFSNWVRDVIADATLAKQLKQASSREAAARAVETKLNWLKARR